MLSLFADPFFGSIDAPDAIKKYQTAVGNSAACGGGLILLLSNLVKLAIIAAGIFALFNFITAGFQYISAAGDPKATGQVGNKITGTIIGLVLVATSFAIAALLGLILFGNAGAILNPVIYGPANTC
jgi:hypothetical protein